MKQLSLIIFTIATALSGFTQCKSVSREIFKKLCIMTGPIFKVGYNIVLDPDILYEHFCKDVDEARVKIVFAYFNNVPAKLGVAGKCFQMFDPDLKISKGLLEFATSEEEATEIAKLVYKIIDEGIIEDITVAIGCFSVIFKLNEKFIEEKFNEIINKNPSKKRPFYESIKFINCEIRSSICENIKLQDYYENKIYSQVQKMSSGIRELLIRILVRE